MCAVLFVWHIVCVVCANCCGVHFCVRCDACAVCRFVSLFCVLLCGLCAMFLTVYSESLIYVVLFGLVSCVVGCLRGRYKVVNDLLCLFCDSVCVLFCYAVCAVCSCVFWVVFSVICESGLFSVCCVLSVLCALCMSCVWYGFFTAC